jgi:hypothetical protein
MRSTAIAFALFLILGSPVHATVVAYTNVNAWLVAAGDHTRITFQGFPQSTPPNT